MNKVELIGRLVKAPELRYIKDGGLAVARYTLAVERRYDKDKKRQADFISCSAFGKSAEFAEKYFQKGMRVAVCGRIQTSSFVGKEGNKIYMTDVIIEEQEFCDSRPPEQPKQEGDFMQVPDDFGDSGLPFN